MPLPRPQSKPQSSGYRAPRSLVHFLLPALIGLASAGCHNSPTDPTTPDFPTPTPSPLTITDKAPAAGATVTTVPNTIRATFGRNLDESKLQPGWMYASIDDRVLTSSLALDPAAANTLVLTLDEVPTTGDRIDVVVTALITDTGGHRLPTTATWQFTYADALATQLVEANLQQVFADNESFALAPLTKTSPGEAGIYLEGANSYGIAFWSDTSHGWTNVARGLGSGFLSHSNVSGYRDGQGGMLLFAANGQSKWVGRDFQTLGLPVSQGTLLVDHWAGTPRLWSLDDPHPVYTPGSYDWNPTSRSWAPNVPATAQTSDFTLSASWTSDRDHMEVVGFQGNGSDLVIRTQRRDQFGVLSAPQTILTYPPANYPALASAQDGRALLAYWRALPFGSQLEVLDFTPGLGWRGPTVLQTHPNSAGLYLQVVMQAGGTALLQGSDQRGANIMHSRVGVGAWTSETPLPSLFFQKVQLGADGSIFCAQSTGFVVARLAGKHWSRVLIPGSLGTDLIPTRLDAVQLSDRRYLLLQAYRAYNQPNAYRLQSFELTLE